MFLTYYLISLSYCLFMSFRKWNRDVMAGGLGITPGLDTLGIVIMAPVLAPVDIFLTWMRIYKEAEEAKRRNTNVF